MMVGLDSRLGYGQVIVRARVRVIVLTNSRTLRQLVMVERVMVVVGLINRSGTLSYSVS